MQTHRVFITVIAGVLTAAAIAAQSPASSALARGKALWDQRLSKSAIAALDAKLESYRSATSAPVSEIVAAIEARAKAQADPAPYFTGAQILIDRGDYARAIATAERGVAVSDKFIDENISAYQMSGKSEG